MKQSKYSWTIVVLACALGGCAGSRPKEVTPDQAAKLDRQLVRDTVVYDPGTKDGAVVPEVSAPRLHAIMVPKTQIGNRIDEPHRAWILEGDVTILGFPSDSKPVKSGSR